MYYGIFDDILSTGQQELITIYVVGIIAQTICLYILKPTQFKCKWFFFYITFTILNSISYYKLFTKDVI
jgi:hypothetical protein